jgi:hypothetical protein
MRKIEVKIVHGFRGPDCQTQGGADETQTGIDVSEMLTE